MKKLVDCEEPRPGPGVVELTKVGGEKVLVDTNVLCARAAASGGAYVYIPAWGLHVEESPDEIGLLIKESRGEGG